MKRYCYYVDNEGESVLDCVVTFNGNTVTFEGGSGTIELLKEGFDYGGRFYTPADGREYVRLLPYAFCGSRFYVGIGYEEKAEDRIAHGKWEDAITILQDVLREGKLKTAGDYLKAAHMLLRKSPPRELAEEIKRLTRDFAAAAAQKALDGGPPNYADLQQAGECWMGGGGDVDTAIGWLEEVELILDHYGSAPESGADGTVEEHPYLKLADAIHRIANDDAWAERVRKKVPGTVEHSSTPASPQSSSVVESQAGSRPEFAALKKAFEHAFHISFGILPIPDGPMTQLSDPLLLGSPGMDISRSFGYYCKYMPPDAPPPSFGSEPPSCLIGFWGHGVNSYAFEYDRYDASSFIHLRLAYGGVYMDNDQAAADIAWFLPRLFKIEQRVCAKNLRLVAIEDMGDGLLQILDSRNQSFASFRGELSRELRRLAELLA